MQSLRLRNLSLIVVFMATMVSISFTGTAVAAKPNILVIWGDDIGQSNISAYTRGMMGYRTPNIDAQRRACRPLRQAA